MLGPEHALLHRMHLAQDQLSLDVFALRGTNPHCPQSPACSDTLPRTRASLPHAGLAATVLPVRICLGARARWPDCSPRQSVRDSPPPEPKPEIATPPHRPPKVLLARFALPPYLRSSERLLRRRQLDEAVDVRQPAVAAASAAGLDGRRARVQADDARSSVGRHVSGLDITIMITIDNPALQRNGLLALNRRPAQLSRCALSGSER